MSIDIKFTVGFTILTTMCYKSESRSAITALRKRGVTTKLENNIIGGRGTHITSKRWRNCRAKGYTRHREIMGARKSLGIGGERENTQGERVSQLGESNIIKDPRCLVFKRRDVTCL